MPHDIADRVMMALAGGLLLVAAGEAQAAAPCDGVARADAHAIEDPQSVLKRGQRLTTITELDIDKKTMAARFCAHGSYCYPADAIALQGCWIATKPVPPTAGDDDWTYEVNPP
jgi:hypothetical protein